MAESLRHILNKCKEADPTLTPEDILTLRRAARNWPASIVAPALLLRLAPQMLTAEEAAGYRARVALGGGDPSEVVRTIDPSTEGFAGFYPPEPGLKRPTTENAIETFLQTYGHRTPQEDALLERMIFNPVPDYAEQLAREEKKSTAPEPSETPKAPRSVPRKVSTTPKAAPGGLLSESLAKIFIKQGRFERAYEIISNINLNYPEKSRYFADQLRFLEKLIINQRHAPSAD